MKNLLSSLLLVGLFSMPSINSLLGQNMADYQVFVQSRTSSVVEQGFFHDLSNDTLWLSPYFGATLTVTSTPYPAEDIVELQIPMENKNGNYFSSGALIGGLGSLLLVYGLGVGNSDSSADPPSFSFGDMSRIGILGALVGGAIGSTIKRKKRGYHQVSIFGDPVRLRSQRALLDQIRRDE